MSVEKLSGDREFCLEAITPAEHDLISTAVDVTMERLIRAEAVDPRSSADAWVSMIELAKRMLLEGKHSAASNASLSGRGADVTTK